MTDLEFDVLDELYFVLSYRQLAEACDLEESDLVATLEILYRKGWLKVLSNVDDEARNPELATQYHTYYYLATKKGLHAHNSN